MGAFKNSFLKSKMQGKLANVRFLLVMSDKVKCY